MANKKRLEQGQQRWARKQQDAQLVARTTKKPKPASDYVTALTRGIDAHQVLASDLRKMYDVKLEPYQIAVFADMDLGDNGAHYSRDST